MLNSTCTASKSFAFPAAPASEYLEVPMKLGRDTARTADPREKLKTTKTQIIKLVCNKNEDRSAKAFVQMRRDSKIIYILAEAEMFPVGE